MAMTTTLRIGLAAACLTARSVTLGADAPTLLRWKFHAGDTIRYEFRQNNKVVTSLDGNDIANISELTLDLSWKVKSVANDGTAEIAQRIERARAKVDAGGQDVTYDSKDATVPSDPVGKSLHSVYKPAVETESTLKVDARGRVIEAHVSDKVTEALKVSPYLSIADGGSVFSDLGVKNLLAQVLPILPEKAASKGATWSDALDLPCPPLKMMLKSQYTLANLSPAAIKIDAALDIAVTPVDKVPFTLEVKKTSKGTGSFTLDSKSGQVSKAKVHHNLELLIKTTEKEVPQTSVIDVEMTLKP